LTAAVLAFRAVPDAVGERSLQAIEIAAPDIDALIDDESRQLLAHPPSV
jgi:hypothetical protein